MAYSDYGGYAYRNGERIEARSDAVLTPEGLKSTPGAWPGWSLPEGRDCESYHVILGDGPVFVGLHKQSTFSVYFAGDEVDVSAELVAKYPDCKEEFGGREHANYGYFRERDETAEIDLPGGRRLEIYWTEDDNFYIYARLTEPDAVWTGWSGYGVGAGLEDAGYGFCTSTRESNAAAHWAQRT